MFVFVATTTLGVHNAALSTTITRIVASVDHTIAITIGKFSITPW